MFSVRKRHKFILFVETILSKRKSSKRAVLFNTKALCKRAVLFFSPFCLRLKKNRFSKFFVRSLCALLCFFSLSFCSHFFFFLGVLVVAFFFNNTSANHVRLFIKTDEREKKAKTLKPFSLFSFLSLILIPLLARAYTKAEKTNAPCSF